MAGYKKMLLARSAIADDETMAKYKFQSNSEFDGINRDELANQMREKIKQ